MRCVCFYSDFGVGDDFAGICRAVIARVAPLVHVIDVTHGIGRHDVLGGALVLRNSLRYTPDRALHLAIVDPGVGGSRRPIAVRTLDGRILVGPDNGLLMPAAAAAGGIAEAVELSNRELWLTPTSATFHGRDIFAPVAARLADGLALTSVGLQLEAEGLTRVELPPPRRHGADIEALVVQIDSFGNAALNLDARALAGLPFAGVEIEAPNGRLRARVGSTFGSVPAGEPVLYLDSSGLVAIAINGGSAAGLLQLAPGTSLRLRPDPGVSAA